MRPEKRGCKEGCTYICAYKIGAHSAAEEARLEILDLAELAVANVMSDDPIDYELSIKNVFLPHSFFPYFCPFLWTLRLSYFSRPSSSN